ncbi:MAG: proteasome-type protease [Rhodospirillales bacterium]|jgi:putative proteasome-type protease|nr:proteasome-type protease [Rhodospirillales bacterium]
MTYCLGVRVDAGLVFASDTRTNAGVDSVATFQKMWVFDEPGERVITVLTAGNLAVTQEVVSILERGLGSDDAERSLMHVDSMFYAARIVGSVLRSVFDRDGTYFKAHGTEFNASLIVGGQIVGEAPRLFLIYPAGNFIEAGTETPYFQLGETKYGKPILERVLTPQVGLLEVAKCALVSFDSTIKANISVAPPIDLMIYEADSFRVGCRRRISDDDPYFTQLRRAWAEGLRRVFNEVPAPPWSLAEGAASRLHGR